MKTIGSIVAANKRSKRVTTKSTSSRDSWIEMLARYCDTNGIKHAKEYRFHHTRQWRFDFAMVDDKIAIEYEGVMSKKSRHKSVTGYTEDCNKYNEAAKMGWVVLRYTAMNIDSSLSDIKELTQVK